MLSYTESKIRLQTFYPFQSFVTTLLFYCQLSPNLPQPDSLSKPALQTSAISAGTTMLLATAIDGRSASSAARLATILKTALPLNNAPTASDLMPQTILSAQLGPKEARHAPRPKSKERPPGNWALNCTANTTRSRSDSAQSHHETTLD